MIFNPVTYRYGDTPVKGVWSFTVPYEMQADGVFQYGNDAAGMTEDDRRSLILNTFIEFGVVAWDDENQEPYVAYLLDKTDISKKQDGSPADLSGQDGDVCVLYRPLWWTVDFVQNKTMTVTFSNDRSLLDSGKTIVSAHQFGDPDTDGWIASYLAVGRYPIFIVDGVARSISVPVPPTASFTVNEFTQFARNGRNYQYNIHLPTSQSLWLILLLFEHNARNLRNKIGQGVSSTGRSDGFALNADESYIENWNQGVTTDQVHAVTCGGLHHAWGNMSVFLGETLYNGSLRSFFFSVQGGADSYAIDGGVASVPSTWHTAVQTSSSSRPSSGWMTEIMGDSYYPFPARTVGGSSTSYWSSRWEGSTNDRAVAVMGDRTSGEKAGPFYLNASNAPTRSLTTITSRLNIFIR